MQIGNNVVSVTTSVLLDPADGSYYLTFFSPGEDEPYDGLSGVESLNEVIAEAETEIRRRVKASFSPLAVEPRQPPDDSVPVFD